MRKHQNIVLKHHFLPLSGIIGLFLVLGIVYLWLIPPFEGPDEAQHFAYIKWLVTEGSLPPQGDIAWQNGVEQESGQPPFYYFIVSLPARLIDFNDPPAVYRPNPHFVGPLPRTLFDNDNRAIFYPADTETLRGGWVALYLARTITLSFGILLIVGVYGLVRQIWPEQPTIALGAAFLVAVTPQVLFISSMASNDIPAAALCTLALWLFALYLRQYERSPAWGLLVGVVLGLAGLTKVSGFTLSIPIGLGLAWLWLSGRRSLGQVVQFGLAFTLGMLVTSGWWLGHNWLTQGSPFGLNPHDQTPWAIAPGDRLDPFLFRWLEVWRSYWLALGWGTIRLGHWPGGWPYTLFFGLLFLALVGWLRTLWIWWRQPENRPSPTTLVLLGLLFVSLIINMLSLESWMHRVIAPYGRLLFPLIGAISVFLIVGWQSLHPRLPWLAYAYIAALGILTPVILIQPAYTHTALTPAEIAALPPSLGWRFGETTEAPFAELISFTPQETTITAGDILQVELCWRALATPSQDYSVMVQIIGPENSLLTSQRSYPDEGRYPTSIWQPGEVWCDVMHVLTYTGNVFETLVHKLEIGLLDDKTGERLLVTDSAGNLLSSTFIDHIRLIPYGGQLFAANIAKTPSLQLVNRRLSSDWRAGSSATLFLTWVTLEPLVQDYQVFIHLRDLQTGENVINGDGPPLDGWYPTSWWSPYEVIHDVHTVDLPDDLTPGTYHLVVGMYDLATGLRPMPEIDLGPVQVTP